MNRIKFIFLAVASAIALTFTATTPTVAGQHHYPMLLAANDVCADWCDVCPDWKGWGKSWCNSQADSVAPTTAGTAATVAAEAPKEAAKPAYKKIPSGNPQSGDPEAIQTGTQIYFTWCVQCHGQKANGESRFGAYAGDLTRFWRGYKEFVKIVQNGRTGTLGMMPPWKEYMDEETIGKIGAFLETRAEPEANWK